MQRHLDTIIVGTAVDVSDEQLAGLTDVARVCQSYGKGVIGDGAAERRELELVVLGLMALRGAS